MTSSQIQVSTPEQVSLNYKVAGLGSRATAHILDWLILGVSIFALAYGLDRLSRLLPASFTTAVMSYGIAIGLFIIFALFWGYFMLFEFFAAGRTPGKLLVGIRVMQDNGQGLTFLGSAVRNLIRIIDFLPSFYLLGMLMIFVHDKHKRIGDLAAGTVVVYQRRVQGKKRQSRLEKEIARRLDANPVQLELDEWTRKRIGGQEWKLLETYVRRRPSLAAKERKNMTQQLAGILFPLLGLASENQPIEEVENKLLALYQLLKEDWQYETL